MGTIGFFLFLVISGLLQLFVADRIWDDARPDAANRKEDKRSKEEDSPLSLLEYTQPHKVAAE